MYLDPTAKTAAPEKARVGDVEIAYDVRGPAGADPILLVPGLAMSRLMWPEELCELLATMGFSIVRMDNRDAGESTILRDARVPNVIGVMQKTFFGLPVDVPYQLEDMAEDAFGLMTALGHERFHVVGASMGGMIAQTMAIAKPERLFTMTSIMSGPGGRRYAVGKVGALRSLLTPMPRDPVAQIDHLVATFRILNGSELPFDEDGARRYSEVHCAGGVSPAASARQLAAILHSANRRRALLRNVLTPTLVVHGTADPLLPMRGAVAMAQQMPDAELLVVRGMGHNFPPSTVPLVAGAIASHARRTRILAG